MRPTLHIIDHSTKAVTIGATGFFGVNEMTMPLGPDDFVRGYNKWLSGEMIQGAFPTLTPEQREFLMTGMSVKQQNEIFGSDNDPTLN